MIPGHQRSLDKLKAMRVHLSNEVSELINDFGPNLYEDFDEVRCAALRSFLFFIPTAELTLNT